MKRLTDKLFERAEQARSAAQLLFEAGDYDAAANRAYYSMFYVAEALLNEKDLEFRKHSAVHSAFGFHHAKTGLLDSKYHEWILEAFGHRGIADYGGMESVVREDAEEMIVRAAAFIAAARAFLQAEQ